MKHDEPRQYEMCCAPGRSTTLDAVYERELAAKFSLFLFLWPGRRKTILLTSPFIERIARISREILDQVLGAPVKHTGGLNAL